MPVFINKCVSEWKADITSDEMETVCDDLLYGEFEIPKTITPRDFISKLKDTRKQILSMDKMPWRGKIMPEHWAHNITTELDNDKDMVEMVLCIVQDATEKGVLVRTPQNQKSPLCHEVVLEICKVWEESPKNTFDLDPNATLVSHEKSSKSLGINMKCKTYKLIDDTMKQPDTHEQLQENYPPWYEDTIVGLSEAIEDCRITYHPEILQTPDCLDHPIATIAEETCTRVLNTMLKTKCARMSSKIQNLYSRLGGAYSGSKAKGQKKYKQLAIFPIVASGAILDEKNEIEGFERSVSGVVVRGPIHARKPTDRIGMITMELLSVSPDTTLFLDYLPGSIVYQHGGVYVVVRQNSVMKEDCCYSCFPTTALFTPVNLLGCMTLENGNVSQSTNM